MAVSVCMDRLMEMEVELAAKRKGITTSQFIIEAVERALDRKDPYQLWMQVMAEADAKYTEADAESTDQGYRGDLSDSDAVRAYITQKLRRKHGLDAS